IAIHAGKIEFFRAGLGRWVIALLFSSAIGFIITAIIDTYTSPVANQKRAFNALFLYLFYTFDYFSFKKVCPSRCSTIPCFIRRPIARLKAALLISKVP